MEAEAGKMTLRLAQDLVNTVARAFYPDDYLVVLDVLNERRYLLDSETSGKSPLEEIFRTPPKQIRTILKDLHREGLIQQKDLLYINYHAALTQGKHLRKSRKVFWYINYRHFVRLVNLRVSLMKKEIEKNQTTKLFQDNEAAFKCFSCGNKYSLIDAQRCFQPQAQKFYCYFCFEQGRTEYLQEAGIETKKSIAGKQASSIDLKGPGNGSSIAGQVKSVRLKRKEQMSTDKSLERDGIFDLLLRLKEISSMELPENLPEEHLRLAEEKFRDIITKKKQNNEIDETELNNFLTQLESMKNEKTTFLETDLNLNNLTKGGNQDGEGFHGTGENGEQGANKDWSLNALHSDINQMSQMSQGEADLLGLGGKNGMNGLPGGGDGVRSKLGGNVLPAFFKKDLSGNTTMSALEDKRDRERHKIVEHLNNKKQKKTNDDFLDDDEEYGGAIDMLAFRKSLAKVS